MITIYNFKASFGDTFFVEIKDSESNETNILIDCGKGFQRDGLLFLKEFNKKKNKKIDRFIITHYDDDHIAGAYSFLTENGVSEAPNIIQIEQVWLNTFRHLQFSKRSATPVSEDNLQKINLFKAAYTNNIPTGEEGEIGSAQALSLGRLVYGHKYVWNADFSGLACVGGQQVTLSNKEVITILTPTIEKLRALETEFIAKLKAVHGLIPNDEQHFDDAYELYTKAINLENREESQISNVNRELTVELLREMPGKANYVRDESVGNGSSISFILEADGKRLLFLADAHAEDVITALGRFSGGKPLVFDAIKVAHHGSFRNNKPELFDLIDSSKFIFSTNGKHPSHVHPDIETIASIITRPLSENVEQRMLYFNYDLPHLAKLDNPLLKQEFRFDISLEREITI